MLDDLRDPEVRERLAAIWDAPADLDPAARAARVARDIADLLASVARRLEKRGHAAERTSGFLMRLLFTMFAEDSGQIPENSFTNLLKNQRAAPQYLERQFTALWVRGGREMRIAMPTSHRGEVVRRDPALIKLVVKAHAARAELEAAPGRALVQVAEDLDISRDYLKVQVRLSWLTPDITSAVLDGHQPATLTRQRLARVPNLPVEWQAQREALGLA